MSEYWKSTPKYWCKHCSTYVKDTKFERTQHEATAKHQGNLRRFLKGIQDGQERREREKQRAKVEVERLNKLVGSSSASLGDHNAATNRRPTSIPVAPQASVTERKKQLVQLAGMGIAVPEEFRGEMAMAGDWKVVSQRPIEESTSEDPPSVGVRKRKYEGQDEEEEAGEVLARRGWGATSRKYPGADEGNSLDLDVLLSGVKSMKKEEESEEKSALPFTEVESLDTKTRQAEGLRSASQAAVKKEEPTDHNEPAISSLDDIPPAEEGLGAGVVFKKRKPKAKG